MLAKLHHSRPGVGANRGFGFVHMVDEQTAAAAKEVNVVGWQMHVFTVVSRGTDATMHILTPRHHTSACCARLALGGRVSC